MRISHPGKILSAVVAVFLAMAGHALSAPPPPSPLPRYVHDDAGWLGAHSYSALDLRLDRLERKTGWKLLVAILPGLPEGEDAADFTRRMFDGWLPGPERQERAMLLAACDDRTIRILAGSAASLRLPEAERARVVSEMLAVVADDGREAAIEGGVESIISILGRPPVPAPTGGGTTGGATSAGMSRNGWTIVAISSLMVVWIIVRTLVSRRARR
ncbi:TPM domain-containing protein [Luteolibacter sp. SL250]|uniref:TPM domain-containing protein n=1 Tax=Luteolibacter sp. SL250 TaxID=2995170 RepID=UPI00226E709E|nr:TPM domain-containing protein [Luteolibacter sp. SL250]WAC20769.1 TPM domain-containing protein [Luteolibacter sp. SL250]